MYERRTYEFGGGVRLLIFLDVNMPENTFECPFLEEDCETNELYCYFKSASGESGHCVGLCAKECPIILL